jgi:UDP-N-acetyl-D-galactosamine dehydrogenase
VAEAAKVIGNTQRDVKIGRVNELALLCHRLGIDTQEVLAAAGTKWNFLPFKPGLVGGHCIGVDPYYLAYKAQEVDFNPEMVLAGRRLNDSMGVYVAATVTKLMIRRQIQPAGARVLVLGLTFKGNTPDVRNTKIVDVVRELEEYGSHVDVHDPWADAEEAREEYGLALLAQPEPASYDAIVVAVAHREFVALGFEGIRRLGAPNCVLYDIKHLLPKEQVGGRH